MRWEERKGFIPSAHQQKHCEMYSRPSGESRPTFRDPPLALFFCVLFQVFQLQFSKFKRIIYLLHSLPGLFKPTAPVHTMQGLSPPCTPLTFGTLMPGLSHIRKEMIWQFHTYSVILCLTPIHLWPSGLPQVSKIISNYHNVWIKKREGGKKTNFECFEWSGRAGGVGWGGGGVYRGGEIFD